jgi:serine kinase of HPr protein (carbohydrate metabolism regulator)
MILHAGLIARRLGGRWRGVLIEGASGAGKTDLALRALDNGFRLVADDQTVVWSSGGALFGRAPEALRGLIEARGFGLLRTAAIDLAQVIAIVTCALDPAEIERLPDPKFAHYAEVTVPRLLVNAWEHSAPAKLWRAMEHLGAASQRGYHTDPLGGPCRAGTGETP